MANKNAYKNLHRGEERTEKELRLTNAKYKIGAYFRMCKKNDKAPTKAGLTRIFNLWKWSDFEKLADGDGEESTALKYARIKLREWWESRLGSDKCTAGIIFWHKNDGWRDTQDVRVDSEQAKAITEAQRQAAQALAERAIIGLPLVIPSDNVPRSTGENNEVQARQPISAIMQDVPFRIHETVAQEPPDEQSAAIAR